MLGPSEKFLRPLQGLGFTLPVFPRLTPWATSDARAAGYQTVFRCPFQKHSVSAEYADTLGGWGSCLLETTSIQLKLGRREPMYVVMAALARSVLSRFCGMAVLAAILCPTPKASGVLSVPAWTPAVATLPSPRPKPPTAAPVPDKGASEVRQGSLRLRSGILAATVNWTVDGETSSEVLRGYVEYHPNAEEGNSCSSIRFIQVAETKQNGGADYEWQGQEQHRNLLRTSSAMGDGIQSGYFVDHKAIACTPGKPCSPYFRDSWANVRESRDGFQIGRDTAPASLVDYPVGWQTLEQISLESCARCVETGQFLGCAQWGARWPLQGERSIAPINIHENPSKTFLAALRKFEKFY